MIYNYILIKLIKISSIFFKIFIPIFNFLKIVSKYLGLLYSIYFYFVNINIYYFFSDYLKFELQNLAKLKEISTLEIRFTTNQYRRSSSTTYSYLLLVTVLFEIVKALSLTSTSYDLNQQLKLSLCLLLLTMF